MHNKQDQTLLEKLLMSKNFLRSNTLNKDKNRSISGKADTMRKHGEQIFGQQTETVYSLGRNSSTQATTMQVQTESMGQSPKLLLNLHTNDMSSPC
jgi:hypothetical protein